MRKILWMVGLFLNSFAFSQVSEGFNDGEFLHQPVWMGDTGRFFINSKFQLQTKLYNKSDTVYLSTINKNLRNTCWEFYVQMNTDPSSSNQLKIYLAFNRSELDSIGNGYFLQIGETGSSDSYDLYRKSGKSTFKILAGSAKTRTTADTLRSYFKIIHKLNGNWELYSRIDTNETWTLEGSAYDNSYSESEYFGVSLKHTSTKSDKMILDDIKIGTYEPDTIPEQIIQKHDIFISEIMADPSPAVDLPEHEYIELYNPSEHDININNWVYQNGTSKIMLPNYIIKSNEALILCKSTDTSDYSKYGNVIGLSTWPSLLNNGSYLKIISDKELIIDEVNYSSTWYKDSRKADGGYSLEYTSSKKICEGSYLWSASISESGGTPGKANSYWKKGIEDLYIEKVNILSDSIIYIKFNTTPDTINLRNSKNYRIKNYDTQVKSVQYVNPNKNELKICFTKKFKSNNVYEFLLENISTCDNKLLRENSFMLSFINNDDTSLIRVNEIYADPFPSHGLAEAEYIELYNSSPNLVNLDGYSISIGTSKYTLPPKLFKPGEYILLCSNSDTTEIKAYGTCIGINGMISLSNTSATISINNKVGRLIDRVSYKNTWYRDITKLDGGWSLELIDPFNKCSFINKWSSSINNIGGTPGKKNSIADFHIDQKNLAVSSFQNLNGFQFKVKMNKAVDGRYINPAQIYFVGAKSKLFFPQKMEIDSPYYQTFTLTFNTALPVGKYNLVCQYIPSCSRADTNVIIPVNISSLINTSSYIRFSEIMADPSPSMGLPEAEYIELYNNSDEELENVSLFLTDKRDTIELNIELWKARQYLLLSHKDFRNAWDPNIFYLPLNKMISLSNESDSIFLLDYNKLLIESYQYTYMQLPKDKREGGYSYSHISDTWDCKSEFVWQASANTLGGSPGKENESIDHYTFAHFNLTKAEVIDQYKIECSFSPIIEQTAEIKIIDENNAEINFEIKENGRIIIFLKNALKHGEAIDLNIQIRNCLGMSLDTSFLIYNKHIPLKNEVLINEILFNPLPGGVDFIEFYNNSDSIIDIKDLIISNLIDTFKIRDIVKINSRYTLIYPSEYRIISLNSETIKSQYFVKNENHLIETSKMISLPDDKGIVGLLNENFELVDILEYNEDYHLKWIEDNEGRSLERKRISQENNFAENWSSATDDVGKASPTYKNSQSVKESQQKAAEFWLTKDVLLPTRNSNDGQLELNYHIEDDVNLVTVSIFTISGKIVSKIIDRRSVRNTGMMVWDLSVDGKIIPMGLYILHVESYTEKGTRKSYKIPFTIHY